MLPYECNFKLSWFLITNNSKSLDFHCLHLREKNYLVKIYLRLKTDDAFLTLDIVISSWQLQYGIKVVYDGLKMSLIARIKCYSFDLYVYHSVFLSNVKCVTFCRMLIYTINLRLITLIYSLAKSCE